MANFTEKTKETYITRIDELLKKLDEKESKFDSTTIQNCYAGTLTIVDSLYGQHSPQHNDIIKAKENAIKETRTPRGNSRVGDIVPWMEDYLRGMLTNIREEIEQDLIGSLVAEISGEVIGNFLVMAKTALREGHTNVAAVLASAALEDTMKRKAEELGLDVEDKDLSEVISALKGQGFFRGAQSKIVPSFVRLRNNSMHAEWNKIQDPEVSSLIGFLEPFLIENFS